MEDKDLEQLDNESQELENMDFSNLSEEQINQITSQLEALFEKTENIFSKLSDELNIEEDESND